MCQKCADQEKFLAEYTEKIRCQFGPVIVLTIKKTIEDKLAVETKQLADSIILELAGENWADRKKVREGIQFAMKSRKYYLILIGLLLADLYVWIKDYFQAIPTGG